MMFFSLAASAKRGALNIFPLNCLVDQSGIAIACWLAKEGIAMHDETDNLDTPQPQNESADREKAVAEKLDHIANKAAKRASKRQQQYDAQQGIFTR
jgi:hypothetical protein